MNHLIGDDTFFGVSYAYWHYFTLAYFILLGAYLGLRRLIPRQRIKIAFDLICAAGFLRLLRILTDRLGFNYDYLDPALDTCVLVSVLFAVILLVDHLFWSVYVPKRRKVDLPLILKDIMRIALVAGAILLVSKFVFGYELSTLLTTSAVASAIIGFALQDMLGNIIAGIALQIEKPFKVGDWVTVGAHSAEIQSMSWRATRVKDINGNVIVVPNSQISRENILNHYAPTREHAIILSVGAEYGDPPCRVKDALHAAVAEVSQVLASPPPRVFLDGFGDSSINYAIKIWIEDHRIIKEVSDAIYTKIWYRFQREGLHFAFPTRTLYLNDQKNVDLRRAEECRARVGLLRTIPLFSALSAAQLDSLLQSARHRLFARGETVIREGDEGGSLFVAVSGSLQASIRGEPVGAILPGSVFGEMSLLTGQKRGATVTVVTDAEVIEIGHEEFGAVLRSDPRIVEELGRLLAERQSANQRALDERAARSSASAPERESTLSFVGRIKSWFGLSG